MRAFVVTAIALLAAGCVLFVKPVDLGDHCATAGSGACADCLRNVCQDAIDTCCGASDCRSATILGEMDACGNGDTGKCANALATARINQFEEGVRSCASQQCKAICTRGATADGGVRQEWTCTTAREPANDCASCIYESCGSQLDACCSDSSCKIDSSIERDLGACTSGDAPGCAYMAKKGGTSGVAGVVRACITKSCGDKCLGDGLPHQSCTLLAGGSYCACTDAEKSNGTQCSADAIGGGSCVVGLEGCRCGHYSCTSDSYGCSCAFNGGSALDDTCNLPSDATEGATCCYTLDPDGVSCKCEKYTTECSTDILHEYPIASCDHTKLAAEIGARIRSVCSR